MLVLTRKVGTGIVIGDNIKIQIVKVKGRQVRLSIDAPKEIKVNRDEVQKTLSERSPTPSPLHPSPDHLSL